MILTVRRKPVPALTFLHLWWFHFPDVRRTFPSADLVTVSSGRTIVIFNIGGNKYRLITAIHYNTRKVFVLRFLTHVEYDSQGWKEDL